ncbi:hypothetical protein Aperf_G00000120555 [Anoplocephala perfoliata]
MSEENGNVESSKVELSKLSNFYGSDKNRLKYSDVPPEKQFLSESGIETSNRLSFDAKAKGPFARIHDYEFDRTDFPNGLVKIISDSAECSNTFDRFKCESINDKHEKSHSSNFTASCEDGLTESPSKLNSHESSFADSRDDRFLDDADSSDTDDLDLKLPPSSPPGMTFRDLREHCEEVITDYIAKKNSVGSTAAVGTHSSHHSLPSDDGVSIQNDSSYSPSVVGIDLKKDSLTTLQNIQELCPGLEDDDQYLDDDDGSPETDDVGFKLPSPSATVGDLHEHCERVLADYTATKNLNNSEPQTTSSKLSHSVNASLCNPSGAMEEFADFVSHCKKDEDEGTHCVKQGNESGITEQAALDAVQPNADSLPAFHKSSLSRSSDVAQNGSMDDNDDDFGDFSGFKSAEHSFHKPADNFADFSGFQKSKPPPSSNTSDALVKNVLFHVRTALDSAFSTDRLAGLDVFSPTKHLSSHDGADFKAQLTELWEKTSSVAVNNLLTSVSSHPESFASQQVWNSSYTYSMYLATIGVEIRSTPLIRIKLLEPTPVEDLGNTAISPSPAPPGAPLPTEAPESDWSTSGITNPISTGNTTQFATEADLELFEDIPCKSSSKSTGPVSDLEAEFLHSVIPPPPTIPAPTPSLPSTLLAKISAPQTTSETRIPENVSNVLKCLPDFSYLRKSILAFPVQDQTE